MRGKGKRYSIHWVSSQVSRVISQSVLRRWLAFAWHQNWTESKVTSAYLGKFVLLSYHNGMPAGLPAVFSAWRFAVYTYSTHTGIAFHSSSRPGLQVQSTQCPPTISLPNCIIIHVPIMSCKVGCHAKLKYTSTVSHPPVARFWCDTWKPPAAKPEGLI